VEAIDKGIDCWGIDLHPLACLITSVKTTPLSISIEQNIAKTIGRALVRLQNKDYLIPPIPRLDHWFEKPIQRALTTLIREVNNEPSKEICDVLKVAVSSIIVRVSNQESDTRYAAVKKTVTAEEVFAQFEKAALAINRALIERYARTNGKNAVAKVINQNILNVNPNSLPKNIGLVITSPPYPNAYEYWLYHKYRMYWLGMDPLAVKKDEIGARPNYFKKNHQDERDFESQMGICFDILSKVMIPEGKACFVIGRSIIHGREIDNLALLVRAAKPHGFTVKEIAEREILRTKKSFNPSYGSISREHLIVFSLKKKRRK